MNETYISKSPTNTKKAAKALAEEIKKKPLKTKKALIFALKGNLGAGKTTFIQFLAKEMGVKENITSPTFVLMKKYPLPSKNPFNYMYHIDCYRLKDHKDIIELDFEEIISAKENIVLIEWAEKIKKALPKETIWINFKILSEKEREINIKNG
ncbi:MAG: tRNA (adenosine(37)-N6)-threonylcarbamoyltransferase complex ATPase subunit type 1 TsaE [Candidatus Portnoybacteria bacterium]|nr:tRNA (adenosine(37)-N6)-threonylcarbamoyltransferase complex ATPase subunit type 1 TsaE [Candidatus Portnoybacteria bacterium]